MRFNGTFHWLGYGDEVICFIDWGQSEVQVLQSYCKEKIYMEHFLVSSLFF